MTTLRPYQESDAHLLAKLASEISEDNLGRIVAFDMGLGKTLTLQRAMDVGLPKHVLVLCPAGARQEWRRQFDFHYPDFFNYTICKSSADIDKYFGTDIDVAPKPNLAYLDASIKIDSAVCVPFRDKVKVLVTGYSPQLLKRIPSDVKFDWVILDECQEISNPASQTSEQVERIIDQSDAYCFLLSGTPALDRPEQIWNAAHICQPKAWGEDINAFRYKYMARVPCEWAPSGFALQGLNENRRKELETKLARIMIRRTQEEVASDLPPLIYSMRYVNPKRGKFDWDDKKSYALFNEKNYEQKNETTLEVVSQGIANGQKKFIVFTYLNNTANIIASQLGTAGVQKVVNLSGVGPDARQKKIDEVVNFDGIAALVCTIDSVGVALDFTWAHHGVFCELHFVPGMTSQAVKRFRRLSSKWSIYITFVCCEGTPDERKVAAYIRKQNALNAVMKPSDSEKDISTTFKNADQENMEDMSDLL